MLLAIIDFAEDSSRTVVVEDIAKDHARIADIERKIQTCKMRR